MLNKPYHTKSLSVLIVDDELDICFLLRGMFEKNQIPTSFVNSIGEAEIHIRDHPPTVLFLDNHLPDGLGMDLIPRIKKEYPQIKIVMITARDDQQERTQAFLRGADYFLPKPLTGRMIDEVIRKIN